MKGMSKLGEILICVAICLVVLAGLLILVFSTTGNVDESTTGTLSNLKEPSIGDRVYCKIHCPDPENNCDASPEKIDICKRIAGTPPDFTYPSGTVPGPSVITPIVGGIFIPGGTLEVRFPVEVQDQYDLVADVKIYDSSNNQIADCTSGNTPPDCGFDIQDAERKIIISIPYERDSHNLEKKIKQGSSYKIALQAADGSEVFSFHRAWSCPSPQIREGRYYPENKIIFTFPTDGAHLWVDLDNYGNKPEKIEIGKRSGGAYPVCNINAVVPTCKADLVDVSVADEKRYRFTMPYTEPGKEVAISYPVYAKDVKIKYVDGSGVIHNDAPMCRSGKEGYVYTCPITACYTDATGRYVVSSLDSSGAYAANPACKYDVKQEQCALGCTMLSSNLAECLLPKPDLSNAYMAVKKGAVELLEEVLNEETGKYEEKDELFLVTTGYDKKRVFVAIKNTATELGETNEPKLKANNLEITAFLDSVPVVVSPVPVMHYKSDDHKIDNAPNGNSELLPGDIFEYEIILDGLYEGLGDTGIHTVNIDLHVVGTFPSGLPAKISGDTNTARSYPYTIYNLCCKECSCNTKSICEDCSGRCEWNLVSGDTWVCMMK